MPNNWEKNENYTQGEKKNVSVSLHEAWSTKKHFSYLNPLHLPPTLNPSCTSEKNCNCDSKPGFITLLTLQSSM